MVSPVQVWQLQEVLRNYAADFRFVGELKCARLVVEQQGDELHMFSTDGMRNRDFSRANADTAVTR